MSLSDLWQPTKSRLGPLLRLTLRWGAGGIGGGVLAYAALRIMQVGEGAGWWVKLANWAGADRYAAHSICLSSDQVVVDLYRLSDLTIMVSYWVLGGILVYHRREVPRFIWHIFSQPGTLYLWGAFIVLCGANHGTMVLTLDYGVYILDLYVKLLTALVSAGTAILTAITFYGHNRIPSEIELLAKMLPSLDYEPRPMHLPNVALRRELPSTSLD